MAALCPEAAEPPGLHASARLHATCVAVGGVGVLLCGPSGSGKSDLALRLVDRGADLVADDQVVVVRRDARLHARPHPALAGLIEVRGHGIVRLPHLAEAALGLLVDLVPGGEAERMPDRREGDLLGIRLPGIRIDPGHASADARIRLAVRHPVVS